MTTSDEKHFQVNGHGAGMTPIMGVEQFARSFEAAFEQARSDENDKLSGDGWRDYSGPVWNDCSRVIVYDLSDDTFEKDIEDAPSVTYANIGGNEWQEVARDGDAS